MLKHSRQASAEPEFICLKCGSKRCRGEMHVNTLRYESDPWSLVTSSVECWGFGAIMPRQLARRWDVNYERAKEIWSEKYRNDKRSRVKIA